MKDIEADLLIANAEIRQLKAERDTLQKEVLKYRAKQYQGVNYALEWAVRELIHEAKLLQDELNEYNYDTKIGCKLIEKIKAERDAAVERLKVYSYCEDCKHKADTPSKCRDRGCSKTFTTRDGDHPENKWEWKGVTP
jgi:hypothetical protein